MEHLEGSFRGAGDLELFYQRWRGDAARATLAIVHGFGEHSGRYSNVVHHLVPRGVDVYGFDLRGFGRSPGQRGHINDWSEFRDDLRAFLRKIADEEGEGAGKPLFLMGHSMGALIVLDLILRDSDGLRGAILSGPGLRPVGVAKPHLVLIAKLLSRLWPRFSLNTGFNPSMISRDPEVVRAYVDDPLRHPFGTVRWGTESLATIDWIWDHAGDVTIPILVVQGGADRLVAADGARDFYDQVTFPDKELHVYEGGFHEPHSDIGYEEVMNDFSTWLERHL